MNAVPERNVSPISPAIAAKSIEYGLKQIAKSPEIAAGQIFPALAQSIDHRGAILTLVSRDGQTNIRSDAVIAQHIEKSPLNGECKELLRALYQYVTKGNSLDAIPALAQKAHEAKLPHIAFDIAVYFFSKLRAVNHIQKSEPLIVALQVLGQGNQSASPTEETFQFQRTLENAVTVAISLHESKFSDDSKLKAAIRNTQAIITTARISGASATPDKPQANAYDTQKGFDYNAALKRLRENPSETNLLPIEEALYREKESGRIRVMKLALACFSAEQSSSPPIRRRIADLKILVDEKKIAELDLALSGEKNETQQAARDELAHQLYEFKVTEYEERLRENQDDIKLRMQLSETHRLEGETPLAIQALQKGAANTMDGKQRKMYHVMLGDLFSSSGNHRIALRAYEAAVGSPKPEELALQPNSFEFSALVKMISTLVKLKDDHNFARRAMELLEPIYMHSSEINPEIKELYDQVAT
jgi:hypothetical protein